MTLRSTAPDTAVMAEINITPFTDVLLVLLIIFMILAALITPPGFQKNLPNHALGGDPPPSAKPIEIIVSARGVMYVDGRLTSEKTIYADLQAVRAKRGNLHVSVIADEQARYGLLIRVLDAARAAGLSDLGFVTQ